MSSENKDKIMRVFFDNPTEKFHVREIARLTELNPNTVLSALKVLGKENLIARLKKRHIVELSANVNEKFKQLKRIVNLSKIYESNIIDFLSKEFSPESISVIGSYSTGEDIESSDIDIVVISKEKKEKDLDLTKFEKVLSRKIHLLVTDYKSISNEFYINLINGVVLFGYINK